MAIKRDVEHTVDTSSDCEVFAAKKTKSAENFVPTEPPLFVDITPCTLMPLPVNQAAAAECDVLGTDILTHFPRALVFPPSPPSLGGVTRGSISGAISIEICCGSAGLTAALRSVGLDAVGVDHSRNKQAVKAPVMTADLATSAGQELLWTILKGANMFYLHCAPPCGTATRARDRPISSTLRRQGAPQPPPLRSSAFPLGFPNLTGINAERVCQANLLYAFVCQVCTYCHDHGIYFTVENPSTSYMWETPCFVQLAALKDVSCAAFPQCMHGGRRPVRRSWLGTLPHIDELNAQCDGKHTHDPFTVQKVGGVWQFATASEATYPTLLCKRVAELVQRAAVSAGYSSLPTSISEAANDPIVRRQLLRASVGQFIRGARFPNLISEFKQVIMLASSHPAVRSKQVGVKVQIGCDDSLRSGKILRLSGVGGDGSLTNTPQFCAVGVFRSPLEYSDQAHSLIHPIDSGSVIPDALKRNIFWLLTTSPKEVVDFRLKAIRRITAMARLYSKEDSAMASKLPADHKQVLVGKRLHLLKVLLEECEYPDAKIVDEVSEGLPLTGTMTVSNIFPSKLRTPLITTDQLRLASKWIRPAMHARIVSSGNHATDKTVWEDTLKEVDNGWIKGPVYGLDLAREAFGENHLISRRFGIQQSDKCRSIDDYSESQVNSTVSAFEKIELQTVDDMTALIKCALDALTEDGRVFLSLSDGSVLSGHIPVGSTVAEQRSWAGKTFDLKAAYRQIPTRPDESWATVIGVYDPIKQQAAYFKQVALPFGAVGSVFGFNRLSRAIWAAVCYHLRVTWCNYYDDFPAAELSRTALATDAAIRTFFSIIGWTIAADPKKCLPYSRSFVMLGIIMNLEECGKCIIKIDNKPERIASISALIQQCLDERKCSAPIADELCGKCQFAAGQMHGRMSLGLINLISAHRHGSTSCWMDDALLIAMKRLQDNLTAMQPRLIDCRGDVRPILVFSDGAVEGEDMWQVTCGATILDTSNEATVMFGGRLPIRLIKEWRLDGRLQTIGQAEILPILLARLALPQLFFQRRVFHFVDNDSARQAMVKGYSRSVASQSMIALMIAAECQQQTWSWYMRIPSESNPGDGPSRLRLKPAAENLNARCIPFPEIPEQIYFTQFKNS
jgi:hypothetical protein